MTKTFILLVTWFYYGQPPTASQVEFSSLQACVEARDTVLQDAARLKTNIQLEADAQRRRLG